MLLRSLRAARIEEPQDAAAAAAELTEIDDRRWGFRNEGNTCYANSVLQALYFCEPFRLAVQEGKTVSKTNLAAATAAQADKVSASPAKAMSPATEQSLPKVSGKPPAQPQPLVADGKQGKSPAPRPPAHRRTSSSTSSVGHLSLGKVSGILDGDTRPTASGGMLPSSGPSTRGVSPERPVEETLLSTLRDLFCAISFHPKRAGVAAPHAFINQLRKQNELFRSTMHQDAHEFLGYLLNEIAEELERVLPSSARSGMASVDDATSSARTWIHSLFEGVLTNETRCLTCETVTSRDESFLDLSIDIEDNSSVSACLRQFSANEMLAHKNKFSCDTCCGLQEAEKRMIVKKMPRILALHLKRFKYQEDLQRFTKLAYRVAFPAELRLFNTLPAAQPDPDLLYSLWAVVVHIGVGPHAGHYITLLRSHGKWLCFDDEVVTEVNQSELNKYFGDTPGAGSGYVLFYEAIQVDRPGQTLAHLAHDLTPAEAALFAPMPYQPLDDAHEEDYRANGDTAPALETVAMPSPGLTPTNGYNAEGSPPAQTPSLWSASKEKEVSLKGFFGLGRKAGQGNSASTPAPHEDVNLSNSGTLPAQIDYAPASPAGRRISLPANELGLVAPAAASDNSDAVSTSSSLPSQPPLPSSTSSKGLFGRGFLSRNKSSAARKPSSGPGLSLDVDVPTTMSPLSATSLHAQEPPASPTTGRAAKKRSMFGTKS